MNREDEIRQNLFENANIEIPPRTPETSIEDGTKTSSIKTQVSFDTDAIFKLSEKFRFCEKLNYFRPALIAANDIFRLGIQKHGKYSWLINPIESDATPTNNLDALFRHYTLYSSGSLIDESGQPHIKHLLCRCLMLICSEIREHTNNDVFMYDFSSPLKGTEHNLDLIPAEAFIIVLSTKDIERYDYGKYTHQQQQQYLEEKIKYKLLTLATLYSSTQPTNKSLYLDITSKDSIELFSLLTALYKLIEKE